MSVASSKIFIGIIALTTLSSVAQLSAQTRRQRPPLQTNPDGRNLNRILGGVDLTAADSAVQTVVERLDFDSYKNILLGLTQFGDREQGTERNARAIDWIEEQLQSWRYETGRIHYEYTPRGGGTPEPREEVYATLVGSSVPEEM